MDNNLFVRLQLNLFFVHKLGLPPIFLAVYLT